MLPLGETELQVQRTSLYDILQLHVNVQLSQNRSLTVKDIKRMKRQAIDSGCGGECLKNISDKGFVCKIHKELFIFSKKKQLKQQKRSEWTPQMKVCRW